MQVSRFYEVREASHQISVLGFEQIKTFISQLYFSLSIPIII